MLSRGSATTGGVAAAASAAATVGSPGEADSPVDPSTMLPVGARSESVRNDPKRFAEAKLRAQSIAREESKQPYKDRSTIGQLLSCQTALEACELVWSNWVEGCENGLDVARREFKKLPAEDRFVFAYAIGADVGSTSKETEDAVMNLLLAFDAKKTEAAVEQAAPSEHGGLLTAHVDTEDSAPLAPGASSSAVRAVSPSRPLLRRPGPSAPGSPSRTSPRLRASPSALAALMNRLPAVDDRVRLLSSRVNAPALPRAHDTDPPVRRAVRLLDVGAPSASRVRRPAVDHRHRLADGDSEDSASDSPSEDSSEDDDRPASRRPSGLDDHGRMRRSELNYQMSSAGIPKMMHPGFLANAKRQAGDRNMYDLYKYDIIPGFKEGAATAHSKNECLSLARIIDAALARDVQEVLELACRRLGGVQTAVETGNWEICARLESQSEQRSFIPAEFMETALKSVSRMQKIRDQKSSGRGPKSTDYKSNKSRSGSSWTGRSKESSDKKKESSRKKKDDSDKQ